MTDDPEIIESGKALSNALIPRGGSAIGSVAVMECYGGSVLVGGYGYLGYVDDREKVVYDFRMGSRVCRDAFEIVVARLEGYRREAVEIPYIGYGADKYPDYSHIEEILNGFRVRETAQAALEKREEPLAGMAYVLTEREYQFRKIVPAVRAIGLTGGNGELSNALAEAAEGKMRGIVQEKATVEDSRDLIVDPFHWDIGRHESYMNMLRTVNPEHPLLANGG